MVGAEMKIAIGMLSTSSILNKKWIDEETESSFLT